MKLSGLWFSALLIALQGHSPKLKSTCMAGQSHRLTSGGKAEIDIPE
jgi:hypothetical protein